MLAEDGPSVRSRANVRAIEFRWERDPWGILRNLAQVYAVRSQGLRGLARGNDDVASKHEAGRQHPTLLVILIRLAVYMIVVDNDFRLRIWTAITAAIE